LEEVDERSGKIEELDEVTPNTVDASHEKHVPVVEEVEGGVLVKIGSEPHPMEPEHFIMWIEVSNETEVQRKYLQPGDAPEANFKISAEDLTAYAYCNIHGLWKN
jgi:superoxide reductase